MSDDCTHHGIMEVSQDNPDGSETLYWECEDCGAEFVPRDQLATERQVRERAEGFATDLSKKAGCWTHGATPDPWCPHCGAMGAVVFRAEKAEASLAAREEDVRVLVEALEFTRTELELEDEPSDLAQILVRARIALARVAGAETGRKG